MLCSYLYHIVLCYITFIKVHAAIASQTGDTKFFFAQSQVTCITLPSHELIYAPKPRELIVIKHISQEHKYSD